GCASQSSGSEKAFDKLQEDASKIKSRVRRNNKLSEVEINDIVVGDIVSLASGDQIPADGKLISGKLQVNESNLNGEMKEIEKKVDSPVFRSSVVYSGEGLMLVEKVGDATFYGALAKEVSEKKPDSPLKLRLSHLAGQISKMGYIGAALVTVSYLFSVLILDNNFNISLIKETVTNFPLMFGHLLHALTLSVTIIVVAVPEGLPMMITLVLSSNMKRMLKSNVLVRKLMGIETAGNINILFTDKTGTITKGKLEVIGISDAKGTVYHDEHELLENKSFYSKVKLSLIANNGSSYDEKGKAIGGNITDRALLDFFGKSTLSFEKIESIPFSSEKKYSMTSVRYDGNRINLVKGAPELILSKCSHYYENGKRVGLFGRDKLYKQVNEATKRGIRVLALATTDIKDRLSRLTLVGLVYIKDEVRPEAVEGLSLIRNAHINTVMITGDNVETAYAIGKEVGLITGVDDVVLTSEQLNQKSDTEIKKLLPHLRIIARSLPQDKSKLVKLAQEEGLVVGMTGDGVNDAPALKKADVGFAMGSGTEVAKEASDIVILDDNLLSISNAVLYGRTIFKSIRKFIIFQLTVNLCAVSVSIIGPFIGVDTPVTVIQMLWINMVMDTLAGIAFSFEPALKEYMNEKPKTKNEMIINDYMKQEIFITGIFSALLCIVFLKSPFIHSIFGGADTTDLMTAFFGLFIFMSIFNCFNARTHRLNLFAHIMKNKIFLMVIVFILIVQIYLIYYGGDMFRAHGLSLFEFEVMVLIAFIVVPIDWMRKLLLRKKGEVGGV
ncbi:MAG: calcium-translocating P-type ATPase, PMCA-type, partial [Bacilli bacterium]|nr:calcium-translocating P-type ATPase, PMCA-type [Bacilli bacterium]